MPQSGDMTENTPGIGDGGPDGEAPGTDSGAMSSQPPSDRTIGTGSMPPPVDPDVTHVTRTEPPAPPVTGPPVYGPPPQVTPMRPVDQVHTGPIPVAQVPYSMWSPTGQPTPPAQPTQPVQPGGFQAGGPQSGFHQPLPPPTYGGYGPPLGPGTAGFPIGGLPPEPPRRRSTGLVVGVAVLALVLGGAAGGLGGYLVSSNNANVASSLNQPLPANQTSNAPAGSIQSVASKVLPVVVTIAAEFQSQGQLSGDTGSGFIITADGDILTNNHVIEGAAGGAGHLQVIFANGRTVDASIVGRDPTTDIAVIKASGVSGLPIAQFGSSSNLAVGQDVVAIGAPFDLPGTVTSGIVSSLHRPTEAGGADTNQTTVLDAIQTDAPINPGNSGGPLVNMQSQVVGINSAIYSPSSGSGLQQSQSGNVGIGFAIPIDQARRTAGQIIKTGKAIQTVLGVSVADNTPTENGQPSILPNGALIKSVTSNGPAAKAGLQAGAVVVKADGRLVTSSDGLVAAVHAAAPEDKMTLTLSTGATLTVTLAGQTVNVN
jgi:putative serine protease PepD